MRRMLRQMGRGGDTRQGRDTKSEPCATLSPRERVGPVARNPACGESAFAKPARRDRGEGKPLSFKSACSFILHAMRFAPAVLCTIVILAASSDLFSAAHTG